MALPRIALAALLAAIAVAPAATAHTTAYNTGIETGYQVKLIYGLLYEPVSTFQKTGLDLGVFDSDGHPLAGLEGVDANGKALANPPMHVVMQFNDQTLDMTGGLRPQANRPGWYTYPVTFTKVGAYSIRVTGTINGTGGINVPIAPAHQVTDGGADQWPSKVALPDAQSSDLAKLKADRDALQARVEALEGSKKSPGIDTTGMLFGVVAMLGLAASRRRAA